MIKALIINRYDDIFSNYEKYIPHTGNEISYICLEKKDKLINKDKAKQIEIVQSLEKETVLEKARKIFKTSEFEYVIAFSEHDLDIAAEIRTELNINGHKVRENILCRNKMEMKKKLEGTEIKYPKYKKISSKKEILEFLEEIKNKIVIKPEKGDASKGVYIIEKETDIPEQINLSSYEAEEFIEGEIYHVDAIITKEGIPYFKLSKYINNCLEFTKGKALGSITIKNSHLEKQATKLTEKICKTLGLENQAIHLELIRKKDEFFFLEIGGRVGGGEIPFVTLFNEGVDLYELWVQAILNKKIDKKIQK